VILAEKPVGNWQLEVRREVDAEVSVQLPPGDFPATLAGAIARAQADCEEAPADRTSDKGPYAGIESVLHTAKKAMRAAGLAVAPGRMTWQRLPDGTLELVREFHLCHAGSNEQQTVTWVWPVVSQTANKSMSLDKAVSAACSNSLSYFLRDLLLMPREGRKTALSGAGQPGPISGKAALEAQRAAQAAASATAGTPPPAAANTAPAQPPPPAPVGGAAITEAQLKTLGGLRADLARAKGWNVDETTNWWLGRLAQFGVKTARDLNQTQAADLASQISHEVNSADVMSTAEAALRKGA
jgi:hypothetical protein